MASLKRQGLTAFSWDFASKLLLTFVNLLVSVILARLLPPELFGEMALVMAFVAVSQIFMDVGLSSAVIQRRRLHPGHLDSVFMFNLAAGAFLGLLTFTAAPLIAGFYAVPELEPLLRVLSVLFVLYALTGVQNALLRKALRFDLLAKVSVAAIVAGGAAGIGLALGGAGVWSLAGQILTQAAVTAALLWFAGGWRPGMRASFKALRQLWGFGFRLFLTALLETVSQRLDAMIIGRYFPLSTLGFYNRAKGLDSMIVGFSSGTLMRVLFPLLSRVQNRLEEFRGIVTEGFHFLLLTVFLLGGVLFLVSDELIVGLFGERWEPSAALFRYLILSSFAYPLGALLTNVLSSRGRSAELLRLEVLKKTVIAANLSLLLFFGIETFLLGLAGVALLTTWLNMRYAAREMGMPVKAFVSPFALQVILTAGSVWAAWRIAAFFHGGLFLTAAAKASLFVPLYFGLNFLLRTGASKTVRKAWELVRRRGGGKG